MRTMETISPDVERLSAMWTRVGGRFTVPPSREAVDLEQLIARTAMAAPRDYRLFFVSASWLAVHYELVNARRLGTLLDRLEGKPSAVAGAILSVALRAAGTSTQLEAAAAHCRPLDGSGEPLFEASRQVPVLREKTQEDALPLFRRWGLLHDEISMKPGAVRPIDWIRRHCPELRLRGLVGASLESDILQRTLREARSATELSRVLDASYSATYEAADRLVRRGLLERGREGRARPLQVPSEVAAWFRAYLDGSEAPAGR